MDRMRLFAVLGASILLVWGMSCQSPSSSGNPAGAALAGNPQTSTPQTDPAGPKPGVGTLQLTITDALVDNVDRILVKMTEVRVHQYGEEESSGFHTVWSNAAGQEIDILALKTVPIVFTTSLAAGKYNQIRISLSKDPGQIFLKDAPTVPYPLSVPSDEIKVHLQFEVLSAGLTQILLDFDAEQSLHVVQKGKKSEYLLRPVIHPVSQNATAGS
jgi:Domain of unknown function (DUF4382)